MSAACRRVRVITPAGQVQPVGTSGPPIHRQGRDALGGGVCALGAHVDVMQDAFHVGVELPAAVGEAHPAGPDLPQACAVGTKRNAKGV